MARTHDVRRFTASSALALFLLGSNFCVLTGAPMLAAPTAASTSLQRASLHPCCVAAAARAAREHQTRRESTAPCCVAMAQVVAPASPTLGAVPAAISFLTLPPLPTETADFARAVSVQAVRPPERAATPDAGRAPPRL